MNRVAEEPRAWIFLAGDNEVAIAFVAARLAPMFRLLEMSPGDIAISNRLPTWTSSPATIPQTSGSATSSRVKWICESPEYQPLAGRLA